MAGLVIDTLRYKAALGDSVVLVRLGDAYFSLDDDGLIVSEFAPVAMQFIEVAGERFRLAAVPWETIDLTVKAMLAAGYHVAIAEEIEDADSTGRARTSIVRRQRSESAARRAFGGESESDAELRGFAAKLVQGLAMLPAELRGIVRRTIRTHVDVILKRHREGHDPELWPQTFRAALTETDLIEDMAAALAPLSEDNQRRAVRMVNRFAELLPGYSTEEEEAAGAASAIGWGRMEAERPQLKMTGMEADDDAHRP